MAVLVKKNRSMLNSGVLKFAFVFLVFFILQLLGQLIYIAKGGLSEEMYVVHGLLGDSSCKQSLKNDVSVSFVLTEMDVAREPNFNVSLRGVASCNIARSLFKKNAKVRLEWDSVRGAIWDLRIGELHLIDSEEERRLVEEVAPRIMWFCLLISCLLFGAYFLLKYCGKVKKNSVQGSG